MTTIIRFLERWWRPILFVAWIWALMGLLESCRYTAFLRPEFGYILGLGVFTLFGFLVTNMAESRPRRFGIRQALHGLILLLPLAYLWNAKDASLDAYAFRNRSLGPPSVEMPEDASRPYECLGSESETGPAKSVTILDLCYSPGVYEGRRVKLIGMLHKNDPQVRKEFGRNMLVVFRFIITCCAADASPAGVVVDGNDLPDLAESTWVEVEGAFKTEEKNGRLVPVLEQSSLRKISAPSQPYLF